jgi:hypothetical protein
MGFAAAARGGGGEGGGGGYDYGGGCGSVGRRDGGDIDVVAVPVAAVVAVSPHQVLTKDRLTFAGRHSQQWSWRIKTESRRRAGTVFNRQKRQLDALTRAASSIRTVYLTLCSSAVKAQNDARESKVVRMKDEY